MISRHEIEEIKKKLEEEKELADSMVSMSKDSDKVNMYMGISRGLKIGIASLEKILN